MMQSAELVGQMYNIRIMDADGSLAVGWMGLIQRNRKTSTRFAENQNEKEITLRRDGKPDDRKKSYGD